MAKPRINSAIAGETVAATTAWTATRTVAAVYANTSGTFIANFDGATDITFLGVQAGSMLPISIKQIDATSAISVNILYTDPLTSKS
jgi:hypothetical protein